MMSWLTRFLKYYFYTLGLLLLILIALSLPKARLVSPQHSAIILDEDDVFIAQIGGDRRHGFGYWPVDEIPPRIMQATLALEDKRFWDHPGVDFLALARALWQNISQQRRVSGASTLTMQIARMQNPGARTYFKKLQEICVALLINLRYDRETILKHYLRLVPYANRSHGIAHAAYIYFNKPIADLSWAEIAFLAAIPQAPGLSNPFSYKGRERAQRRGARLLKLMYQAKLMDAAEHQLSQQQLLALDLSRRNSRNQHFMHAILYLEQQFLHSRRQDTIIHTHLQSRLQRDINLFSDDALQNLSARGAENIAVVVTRRKDNAVLAWSGSTDYFDKQHAGALDYIRTPRSPGSTLKPFIYALALDTGTIHGNSILDDLPSHSRGIANSDGQFLGPMLPRQALANSRNVPAINLVHDVGLGEVYLNLYRLGLHHNEHSAAYYGLGIAVGSMPTTLEQLTVAYSSLANNGILKPLRWSKKDAPDNTRIFSADTARLISLYLSDPMARLPTFSRMGSSEYDFPVAIKTGTSQGFVDAWTMAYSQEYIVGIWIGRPDAQGMKNLSGSASSSFLAQRILNRLHRKENGGYRDLSFTPPQSLVRVDLCRFSGFLAGNDCHEQVAEWMRPQYKPKIQTPVQWLKIDRRNGLLAGDWTPAQFLRLQKFIQLPSRYLPWARKKGIRVRPYRYSLLNYRSEMNFSNPWLAYQRPKTDTFTINIVSPNQGSRILINPHVPDANNSISLHVDVQGDVGEVLWYVDGRPYQLAAAPYSVRWPLQPGSHSFQVKIPYTDTSSKLVRIRVE